MKYSYLVGHNIKCVVKDSINAITKEHNREYKGYVTKVSLDEYEREIIYIKEDTGILEWVIPDHSSIKIISLKILDTKYNRFEIMDI